MRTGMKATVGRTDSMEQHKLLLPMTVSDLDEWLDRELGTHDSCEVVVYEIELPGLCEDFDYGEIDEVNVLAAVFSEDYDDDYDDAVRAWIDQYGHSLDALEVANILLDAERIPWRTYGGYDGNTPEERYGRMYLNECCYDEMRLLDDMGMLSYIDYESYGKDKSMDCALYDDGYLDMAQPGPHDNWYSLEELQDRYCLNEEEDE